MNERQVREFRAWLDKTKSADEVTRSRWRGIFTRSTRKALPTLGKHVLTKTNLAAKRPKITEQHSLSSKIPNISTDWLRTLHNEEVTKVIREAKSDMTVVRDSQSVLGRLKTVYAGRDRMVRSLFATWVQLSALGENSVKAGMFNRSFYRHRKMLLEAGVAWTGSDVIVLDTDRLPVSDFVPVANDLRCSSSEHPDVSRLLEEHRTVAA